jgi:hypothetical protein
MNKLLAYAKRTTAIWLLTGTSFTSQTGGTNPVSSLWSSGELRNINYFLENYQRAEATDARKRHFAGMARYWRAWFYFELIKLYGNAPWYNKPLGVSDEAELFKPQDSRTLIMDSVLNDITKGKVLWRANVVKSYPDYKYYAPIPYAQIVLNPNLIQNPEWK